MYGNDEEYMQEQTEEQSGILPRDTRLDMEVVRVKRVDYDTEMEDGEPERSADEAGEAEVAAEPEQPKRERFKLVREFMLGTILNNDVVRENYRYAIFFAGLLFLSIAMLFTSLGTYLKYMKLGDEVQLMRERAIRMSEERYEQSSHSAIVRRLQERGINLADPQEPHEILE